MSFLLTPQLATNFSRLGPRATYGQALLELAKINEKIIALSADLGNSSGLDRFKNELPERFVNVGIAEQNLVGVAAGISKEGLIPFASSFAPFITMRAAEQVRMNLGYMQLNVKTVGIGSGLSMGFLGNSHFGLEDIAVMRAIPNITILSPSDSGEVAKSVFAAAELDGPVYIRLTGEPNGAIVNFDDYEFRIGQGRVLREGKDVCILATGSIVSTALASAKILDEKGFSAEVVNIHTIKPLDADLVREKFEKFKVVITIEEHSVIGGLGSAVAEIGSGLGGCPKQIMIGLPDSYGPTGDYKWLLDLHHLTDQKIADRIISELRKSS